MAYASRVPAEPQTRARATGRNLPTLVPLIKGNRFVEARGKGAVDSCTQMEHEKK